MDGDLLEEQPALPRTTDAVDGGADAVIEAVYRSDWGRIVAALISLVGDFEVAEEAAQEAFSAAVSQWRSTGIPDFPRAWIVQTARHKAIDRIRSMARQREKIAGLGRAMEAAETPDYEADDIPDDRLRLIFTCCHPALAPEAQIALTLRTLGGLETEEIARAFLVSTPAMAQRLVRAQRKIRDAGIPYVIPSTKEMPERMEAVLTVIYLIFNEGYASTRGERHVRTELCHEAIRLGGLVRELMIPNPPAEATGLLALMLLHDARRAARLDEAGDLVTLEEQDRSKWDRRQIAEALPLVEEALKGGPRPYAVQAAIAAIHCAAAAPDQTDWRQIIQLYGLLERMQPSPIVSLNRAVAVAMAEGPAAGLAIIDELARGAELNNYHLLHSARADLLRRAGKFESATEAYGKALALATNDSERRFLQRRLTEMHARATSRAALADTP